MKTVIVNKPVHDAALARLREEVQVLTPYDGSYDEMMLLLESADGIILSSGLFMGPAEMDRAECLQVIARHGAGFDIVDVDAATERGIPVTYTPYGPTESTAEHALALMLAVARQLARLDRDVRKGNFHVRDHVRGRELQGKSLGVVGFGRIGRRFAEMCRDALGMDVHVFDPYLESGVVAEWGATLAKDLVKMAENVDVLSIHVPLNGNTRHLVNGDVIRALGPDGILVSAARGPVVDEAALVEALQNGKLAGAGLDVFDPEPPEASNPLFRLDQVVLTPHVASATHEGRRRMGLMAAEDALRVLRGEKPQDLANPAVWEQRRGFEG